MAADSGKKCPSCGAPREAGAAECLQCGVIFAKWRAREVRRTSEGSGAVDVPIAASGKPASGPPWLSLILCVGLGTVGWAFYQRYLAPKAKSGEASVAREDPDAHYLEALRERGSEVLSLVRQEALELNLTMDHSDLLEQFKNGYQMAADDKTLKKYSEFTGYPVPTQKVSREDKRPHDTHRYKCLMGGGWEYPRRFPESDEGVQECWFMEREFFKTYSTKYVIYSNYWKQHWELQRFDPETRSWSALSPQARIAALQYFISNHFDSEKEALSRRESEKLLSEAGMDQAKMRHALAHKYRDKINKLGAEYRLDGLLAETGS